MWKYFCDIDSLELLQLYAEIFSRNWTHQALKAVFERLPGTPQACICRYFCNIAPLKSFRSYLKDSLQHLRLGCGDIFAALEPLRLFLKDSLEFLRLVCGDIFEALEHSRPHLKGSLELLRLYAEIFCFCSIGLPGTPLAVCGNICSGIDFLELLQLYAEIFSRNWTHQASRPYLKAVCKDIFAALDPSTSLGRM